MASNLLVNVFVLGAKIWYLGNHNWGECGGRHQWRAGRLCDLYRFLNSGGSCGSCPAGTAARKQLPGSSCPICTAKPVPVPSESFPMDRYLGAKWYIKPKRSAVPEKNSTYISPDRGAYKIFKLINQRSFCTRLRNRQEGGEKNQAKMTTL